MKILVIGGNGTIGSKVVSHFKNKHEVLVAGRSKGDFKVDISDSISLQNMFNLQGNNS